MSNSAYGYFPQRVSGGSIHEEGLEVDLRDRKVLLSWAMIKKIFLAIVEEPLLSIPPTAYVRFKESLNNFIGRFFLSIDATKDEKSQAFKTQGKIYLEMFVSEQEQPYRIDTTTLNYRGFLPQIDYVSDKNLRNFLTRLSERLPGAAFDPSFWAYLGNKKEEIVKFGSVYEFQRECLGKWIKERQS